MTRVLICLLVTFMAFSTSAEKSMKKKTNSIVGTWKSSFKGTKVKMKFNADGTVVLGEGEAVINGTYKVDLSVTPHHIDFTLGNDKQLSIFKFLDKDTIKMDEPSSKRAQDFGKDAIDFKRQ